MAGQKARKFAFWTAVAGVSVLTHLGMELAAAKLPNGGFRQFVNFLHRGPGGAQ